MIIGKIDKRTTSVLHQRKERKVNREVYYEKLRNESIKEDATEEKDPVLDSDGTTSDSSGEILFPVEDEGTHRNLKSLPTLSSVCDRYDVSNTVGAAIATATLVDFGIITNDDKTAAIDRSKLWRERERFRKTLTVDNG